MLCRVVALVAFLAVPLAGCSTDAPDSTEPITGPDPDAIGAVLTDEETATDTASIAVENLRLVREPDGSQVVRGLVINRANRERNAQVVIALYDASNQRIDEVQVSVEDIEAESQQGFSRALDREAAGVSVRRIIGY
ncbi:MAG: hypothetical protein HKN04_10375 [Rhodothermaceae bacterium]|nr:hypothetical protein [Rhodothermaceae bacterium]